MISIKIMTSGEQRKQQQQLEKRGCKVSHSPIFHEFCWPTDARTAKIISVRWVTLCCSLFGNVKKGTPYQEECESVTVAENHGWCFLVSLAQAA